MTKDLHAFQWPVSKRIHILWLVRQNRFDGEADYVATTGLSEGIESIRMDRRPSEYVQKT